MDNLYEMNNVAIYIDYENVYKTLAIHHKNLIREGFFEKIQFWCKTKRMRIVKIVAYCNFDNEDLHESYHQTLLQEYGILTVHTSNRGKNYADMQISIDAINDMYLNHNIDQFIVMSNDKDMSPLLNTIKSNKRKAILLTVGDFYDNAIVNVPDEHFEIDEILRIRLDAKYVDKIELRIIQNICEFYSKPNHEFKKLELEYCIKNQMFHNHIMKYELLNIFDSFQNANKIFLYTYYHGKNQKQYYGIAPVSAKEMLISNNVISEANIVKYDFITKINELYNKLCENTLPETSGDNS